MRSPSSLFYSNSSITRSIFFVTGFVLVWVLLVIVELDILGATYPYLIADNETGNLGIGLNWRTLDPLLFRHHPAPTFNIFYGLISNVLENDFSNKTLEKFILIGIVFQGVFVVLAAIWSAWISDVLEIDTTDYIFLIALTFSMPSILFRVGHPGVFFELGIIGLPVGLTLIAALRQHRKSVMLSGLALGVLVANFYLSWVVVFSFLFGFSWLVYRISGLPRVFRPLSPQSTIEWMQLLLLLSSVISITAAGLTKQFASDLSFFVLLVAVLALGTICFGILYFVLVVLNRWEKCFGVFLVSFLSAFVISNFVLLPWYFVGISDVMAEVGTRSVSIKAMFLFEHFPWLYLLWFFLLSLLIIFLYTMFRKKRISKGEEILLISAIFACVGTATLALLNTPFLEPGGIPGAADRSMITATPLLVVGWFALFSSLNKSWCRTFKIFVTVLCIAIVGHYYVVYGSKIKTNREQGILLDQSIENFLSNNFDGRLVCVGEEFNSRYCATAYAYNRYRTDKSVESFPTKRLFNGQVISINVRPGRNEDWIDRDDVINRLIFDEKGPRFVVMRAGAFREHLLDVFYTEKYDVTPLWSWKKGDSRNKFEIFRSDLLGGSFVATPDWKDREIVHYMLGRKDTNYKTLDLSGQDIRRSVLGGQYLRGAILRDAILIEMELTRAQLQNAILTRAKLSSANLFEANLSGANFYQADLIEANLADASLAEASLWGADLRGADLQGTNLRNAKLWRANFDKANLRGANFVGADLELAIFSDAQLKGVDFRGMILTGVNFSRANLREANLANAKLNLADLKGANLYGANLQNVDLSSKDLTSVNLSRAYLAGAQLKGANLSKANLSHTDLSGKDLTGVNFRDSHLVDVNMDESNLSNSDFRGAIIENLILPSPVSSGAKGLRDYDRSAWYAYFFIRFYRLVDKVILAIQ